jgi:hypothetical protein
VLFQKWVKIVFFEYGTDAIDVPGVNFHDLSIQVPRRSLNCKIYIR